MQSLFDVIFSGVALMTLLPIFLPLLLLLRLTGEKDFEEFFTDKEDLDMDRFETIGVIRNKPDFDESKLLAKLPEIQFNDFQGTHWQPSLISVNTWNKVGGFSEEFSPGLGSDPDFNMKLWNIGVRLFKGLSKCRVYHFSSISLRKKAWNNGAKTFLLKWGISIKFFKKHYLRSDKQFDGILENPKKNINYYLDLLKCKISLLFHKIQINK